MYWLEQHGWARSIGEKLPLSQMIVNPFHDRSSSIRSDRKLGTVVIFRSVGERALDPFTFLTSFLILFFFPFPGSKSRQRTYHSFESDHVWRYTIIHYTIAIGQFVCPLNHKKELCSIYAHLTYDIREKISTARTRYLLYMLWRYPICYLLQLHLLSIE